MLKSIAYHLPLDHCHSKVAILRDLVSSKTMQRVRSSQLGTGPSRSQLSRQNQKLRSSPMAEEELEELDMSLDNHHMSRLLLPKRQQSVNCDVRLRSYLWCRLITIKMPFVHHTRISRVSKNEIDLERRWVLGADVLQSTRGSINCVLNQSSMSTHVQPISCRTIVCSVRSTQNGKRGSVGTWHHHMTRQECDL